MFNLGRSKTPLSTKSSSDGLAQHPLLGAPSVEAAEGATAAASGSDTASLSNLPYKPRQPRHGGGSSTSSIPPPLALGSSASGSGTVPTLNVTSATSSASVQQSTVSASAGGVDHAASGSRGGASPGGSGSVTARLQLQSLKAAGQRMGLRGGSVGMQVLEALFDKGQVSRSGSGGDWGEVLKMITVGKATLLLPTCPQTSSLPMTPQTLRDHIVFPTSGAGSRDMLVTLSGLVGTVQDGRIVVEDCLAPDGLVMGMLKEGTTRSTILGNIHAMHPPAGENRPAFPAYSATISNATLPFPPPPPPPPAQATGGNRSRSSSNASATLPSVPSIAASASRLNPFASLFGGSSGATQASSSPTKDIGLSPDRERAKARPPSIHSVDAATPGTDGPPGKDVFDTEPFHIPAWLVDRQIKYADVTKALSKALRGRVEDELKSLPDKIIERTSKFVLRLHPAGGERGVPVVPGASGDKADGVRGVSDAEATSQAVQAFVEGVYDEIYAQHLTAALVPESPSTLSSATLGSLRRRTSQNSKNRAGTSGAGSTPADEEEREKEEAKKKERHKRTAEEQAEKAAAVAAESVERVICCLLYNHLFSPPTSDDARHDEALSSRIAALNLLELSLDHLGIQTKESPSGEDTQADIERRNETVMSGLGRIVEAVGKELELLDSADCHTAKQKTDHLINAHKLITDGLSKLPPIRLRPEGEPDDHLSRINSPLSIDAALDGHDGIDHDQQVAAPSDSTSVPPPLPPRPSTAKPAQATARDTQDIEDNAAQTPSDALPILELPDAARPSAVEEAMSESILEQSAAAEGERKGSSAQSALSRVSSRQSVEVPQTFDGGSSGADLLLPLAIYSIVKSNPNRLVSHVLFVQRYRSAICLSGEASYAIVNLTAVIEFLEHVDLAELGLTSSEKVMSVADLSPIGLTLYDGVAGDAESIASASSRLRGRVNQVGEIAGSAAGSANKVLAGVVDSGWSALRGLIAPNLALPPEDPAKSSGEGADRPRMPARKGSAFSIHSVTASVASIAAAAASHRERPRAYTLPTVEREMTEVTSRPESLYERDDIDEEDEEDDETDHADNPNLLSVDKHTRGRAVSSSGKLESERSDRLSISDRFANMTALGKLGSPNQADKPLHSPPAETSSISSFFGNLGSSRQRAASTQIADGHDSTPPLESDTMPIAHLPAMSEDLAPPIERFLTCDAGDLRLSEIGELLRDYRRLARMVGNKA